MVMALSENVNLNTSGIQVELTWNAFQVLFKEVGILYEVV